MKQSTFETMVVGWFMFLALLLLGIAGGVERETIGLMPGILGGIGVMAVAYITYKVLE